MDYLSNELSETRPIFRDFMGKEDLIKDFKFPRQDEKPKFLPSKNDLKIFFNDLPSLKYKIIFLALASSGLRISELLNAEIDTNKRMFIPQSHDGGTKKSWITFYNKETENLMESFDGNPFTTSRNTVAHAFKKTSNKIGVIITAQILRSVFAIEMGIRKVPHCYIDAFYGRVP